MVALQLLIWEAVMAVMIDERIARYETWRLRQPADRPLIGVLWEPDVILLDGPIVPLDTGAMVSPEDIHPEGSL